MKFGSLTLEHVLKAPIESVWEELEHPAPYRAIAYRREKWSLGRTVKVDGEIRETTRDDATSKLRGLRAFSDGQVRLLDFEYVETSLHAMLGDITWSINVENGWFEGEYIIAYTATFLE
jgi:hypothetical protein